MIKEIDIDKLHDVLEGRTGGRNIGKTFARCVQAMQYVESGIERVYFFVNYRNDLRHTIKMMKDIFDYYDMPLQQTEDTLLRHGNSAIRFLVHSDGPYRNKEIMGGSSGLIIKDLLL